MIERSQRFEELLRRTRLYAITDDALPPDRLLATVEALVGAGVRLFQYRAKHGSDRERAEVGRSIVAVVRAAGGLVLVNDRVDIALAADADGAHLGQDDLPLMAGRAMLGRDRLLGASASYLRELRPAVDAGADYLGFGAVFATDTKPDAEYAGLDLLAEACSGVPVPVVAIGGIDVERAPQVIARGAAGIAVVSALFRMPDPAAAARALLARLR